MAYIKPSTPKGTRDFSPTEMVRRNFIFDTIKSVFRKYGYQQIETPAMENSSTLMGKYGEEGDKLIFKILDSGDFLDKTILIRELEAEILKIVNLIIESHDTLQETTILDYHIKDLSEETINIVTNWRSSLNDNLTQIEQQLPLIVKKYLTSKRLSQEISEKALRYDLTVPFARYVVMHQNEIAFPFKRFQVQPVWRADRPQRGRYREFYQCDADVVGSPSLLNEAEFVMIYDEALSKLGLKDFTIKINNRKILGGIAEIIGKPEHIIDLTVAIDKLDKIGLDGVIKELLEKGFEQQDIDKLKPVILLQGSNAAKLNSMRSALAASATGLKGCDELETVFAYIENCPLQTAALQLDITLARGLNYYTGAIFEVKTNEVAMGSIGGGGRYDDLTGMFGLKGLTGVGISFGADRIYDVMDELNLFPTDTNQTTKVLICCFDAEGEKFALPLLHSLRRSDINSELYPAGAKMKKQLDYANNKHIPFTIVIGNDEIESGLLTFKDMYSGLQEKLNVSSILERLRS